jgi:hypothetical protein
MKTIKDFDALLVARALRAAPVNLISALPSAEKLRVIFDAIQRDEMPTFVLDRFSRLGDDEAGVSFQLEFGPCFVVVNLPTYPFLQVHDYAEFTAPRFWSDTLHAIEEVVLGPQRRMYATLAQSFNATHWKVARNERRRDYAEFRDIDGEVVATIEPGEPGSWSYILRTRGCEDLTVLAAGLEGAAFKVSRLRNL